MRNFLCLILVAAGTAAAATPAPRLGIHYGEWLGFPAPAGARIATDSTGAIYFLTSVIPTEFAISTVTKLSPDGKTILWQNQLDFGASVMTVDPNGGVYVVPDQRQADITSYVEKLNATGAGVAWKISVGFLPQSQPVIAVDSQGAVYFAAANGATTSGLVRINAAGNAVDFTTAITGTAGSIAVDSSGAAYLAGAGFLAKVATNGTSGYYSALPDGTSGTVAVDGSGNVTLFSKGLVQRMDGKGAVAIKTRVDGDIVSYALDTAGNAYVTATSSKLYPVRNTLITCGLDSRIVKVLHVIAPDGSILQTTYLPGFSESKSPELAVTPNGVLYVGIAGPAFAPTQTGPFAAGTADSLFLWNLSYSAVNAPVYSLGCAGNSASLAPGPISPGELVTLYGNGLGPQQGVETHADASDRYPAKAGNVEVTIDGIPAPLLWVQNSQINLVAPWSLIPGRNAEVCVSYDAVKPNCLTLPVVESTPAVFMVDNSYAAALNQDGTYNSATNPAAPGSIVTVFATGLGAITPSQPDGSKIELPLPANAVTYSVLSERSVMTFPFVITTTITHLEVLYAGPAPTQVAGVSQVNFRVGAEAVGAGIRLHSGLGSSSPSFGIHVQGE